MKKTKLFLGFLIIFACKNSKAQNWLTAGNAITTTEFFGATAASIIPLNIRHNAAG